jgi:transposase-like protein
MKRFTDTDARAGRFTAESAANVRALLDARVSVRQVARTYGVSPKHIREIRDGRMWKL